MDNYTLLLPTLFQQRIFLIPDYQRGYAWEKEQVGELLEDLEMLNAPRRHYAGTIVLCKTADAPIMGNDGTLYATHAVVDGQQRLTTIVLLLNELSRALAAYPDCADLAEGIRKNYVQTKSRDNWPIYKLSLNKDTHAFYRDSVLPETPSIDQPPVRAAARLRDAKKQIEDYLRRADDELESEHRESLTEWHAKLTQQLHFNLYEVEKEAEVGVIFEVMNDRGKPLTELEKVKNYLLYAASSLDVDEFARDGLANSVNDAWAKILSNLMTAGLGSSGHEDQLLQMHWIMQCEPQARNWDGVKSVKGKFGLRKYAERHNDLLVDLRKYAEGLRDSSVAYCDARNPNRSGAFGEFQENDRSELRRWNSKLMRIGVRRPFLPLLMAVRQRWPSEPQKYLEALKLCEAFAFRIYSVGRAYSNYREPAMFRLAYAVAHGLDFDEAVARMKRDYGGGWARRAFDSFTNAAGPSPDYGYSWSSLRYFLYEYEEHLAAEKGAEPKVAWQEFAHATLKDTIEHVLPQYIEKQPYWQKQFTDSEHEEYVHDVGNLALTKWNSHYSNKPFPEKRGAFGSGAKCYAEAPFYQELELAQQENWTKESIDARRAKLNAWAKERWRVDFSDVDGTSKEDVEPDEDEMDDEADIEDENAADEQG